MERRNRDSSYVSRHRLSETPFMYRRLICSHVETDLAALARAGLWTPSEEWNESHPQVVNLRGPEEASILPFGPTEP